MSRRNNDKGMVPITRAFLREHFKDWKLPLDCEEGLARVIRMQERLNEAQTALGALDGTVATLPQALSIAKPKRIDEKGYRLRQTSEEIVDALKDSCLATLRASLDSRTPGGSSDAVNIIENALRGMRNQAEEMGTAVIAFQTANRDHVEKFVFERMPRDWRAGVIRKLRERSERKCAAEVATLEANRATIRQKYDMLWKQQMDRRAQLVSLGSATGIFKMAIKFISGCPQALLDFVKSINDDEGPLEEMRVTYAPNLQRVLDLAHETHVTIRMFLKAQPLVPIIDGENGRTTVKSIADLFTEAGAVMKEEVARYLDFFGRVFRGAPFFITVEEAGTFHLGSDSDMAFVEVTVARGQCHDVCLEVSEANSAVAWEFNVADKDIGFTVLFRDPTNGKEEVIVSSRRYNSSSPVIQGEHLVEQAGTYVIRFDNSYSLFTSKTLKYRVMTVSPSECVESIHSSRASSSTAL